MASEIALIIVTAVMSSALTIVGAWLLYHRFVKPRLIAWIDTKAVEMGGQLQEQVRDGVRAGFQDGMTDVRNHIVKTATEHASKSGLGLFEETMKTWFGLSRNRSKPGKN